MGNALFGKLINTMKILKKGKAKLRLGFYNVQKTKIRYGWALLSLKMLKQSTTAVLFY